MFRKLQIDEAESEGTEYQGDMPRKEVDKLRRNYEHVEIREICGSGLVSVYVSDKEPSEFKRAKAPKNPSSSQSQRRQNTTPLAASTAPTIWKNPEMDLPRKTKFISEKPIHLSLIDLETGERKAVELKNGSELHLERRTDKTFQGSLATPSSWYFVKKGKKRFGKSAREWAVSVQISNREIQIPGLHPLLTASR